MNQKLEKLVVRSLFLIFQSIYVSNLTILGLLFVAYLLIALIYDNGNYTFNMV